MKNIDLYNQAKSTADADITSYLNTVKSKNDATSLAIAFLTEYMDWYKFKYRKTSNGYVQNAIVNELMVTFGYELDIKSIRKVLIKSGVIQAKHMIITCTIILPLIVTLITYLLFINYYIAISLSSLCIGVVFSGIWCESIHIKLYKVKDIKLK